MLKISEFPSTIRTIRSQANVSPATVFFLAIQLIAVFLFSFTAPFLVRLSFVVPFVELNEPLEFTFHTCTDQLHGVCSFPEAELIFDERRIEFAGGYRYNFALNLDLSDPEILRGTGLFLAQLEVKDERAERLTIMKKTVRVTGPGLYGWYIWLRNWLFLPLYIVGILGDGGVNQVVVEFPSEFRETLTRPAKFIVVQVQSRFIQVSSASLRIRPNVGLSTYLISNFPLITYAILSGIFLFICLTMFTIYWANEGFQLYQRARKLETSTTNKEHLS